MSDFNLTAKSRELSGKGASRRLRRSQEVPAIIYGGNTEPKMISLLQKEIVRQTQNEAFFSHILSIEVDGKKQEVIVKDIQRHPAKDSIQHVDFLRVSQTQKLHTKVPLHFINEDTCNGVKMQGGAISHSMTELEINCLPKDLPEFIEVDMLEVDIGVTIHISDLNLPKGVESVALLHGNLPVASVNVIKSNVEEEPTDDDVGEVTGEDE